MLGCPISYHVGKSFLIDSFLKQLSYGSLSLDWLCKKKVVLKHEKCSLGQGLC